MFLKIEEKDVENALKDRTLLGSILAAGLPSWSHLFIFYLIFEVELMKPDFLNGLFFILIFAESLYSYF